jgi:CRP-like cAMP-binding protein
MTPLAFAPGDTIMAQGELNQKLYFILGGEISCIYKLEETECFVSSLGAGDIMGQAGFFSATVCTVTLKARSRVSACYLQRSQREEWKGEFPALEAKLEEYCRRKDRIRHDLEKRAIERRVHRRLPLSGRMRFRLLNKSEEPLAGAYKGEIEDISPGGLSLLVRSTRADALYTLLGRRVRVGFELPLRSGKHRKLQETMTVIAVEARLFDDYSVHLKFDRRREDRFIEDIDPDKPVLPLK